MIVAMTIPVINYPLSLYAGDGFIASFTNTDYPVNLGRKYSATSFIFMVRFLTLGFIVSVINHGYDSANGLLLFFYIYMYRISVEVTS